MGFSSQGPGSRGVGKRSMRGALGLRGASQDGFHRGWDFPLCLWRGSPGFSFGRKSLLERGGLCRARGPAHRVVQEQGPRGGGHGHRDSFFSFYGSRGAVPSSLQNLQRGCVRLSFREHTGRGGGAALGDLGLGGAGYGMWWFLFFQRACVFEL